MNKELGPSQIQRTLFEPLGGMQGLQRRIDLAKKGWLPYGNTLEELSQQNGRFFEILGNFAPKVLIASAPNNPSTLLPEQIAIAGGWCALRTKDVAALGDKGIIMDPQTATIQQVSSVNQVAEWIQKSVSFDQIMESIGAAQASEYV